MWLPKLEQRYIAAEKITAYLLDADHPEGGPKARFFIRFGFSPSSPEILRAALLEHPAHFEVSEVRPTAMGMRYAIDGPLSSPDRRDPWVRTVWRVPASGAPHLVTAYPDRRRT